MGQNVRLGTPDTGLIALEGPHLDAQQRDACGFVSRETIPVPAQDGLRHSVPMAHICRWNRQCDSRRTIFTRE